MSGLPQDLTPPSDKGLFAWMVHNRVTPNLIMLAFLIGGFFLALNIKQEVFPEFDLDMVNISVSYPGASPEEVEQGIVLAIEEAVRGLDGIQEVTSVAREGGCTIRCELLAGSDHQKVYQDIQQEIDRVRTLPEEAEEPQIELVAPRHRVLSIMVYGDTTENTLRELVEQVRDRLLQEDNISQADLSGVRDYEISVEIPEENLRAYGLTLADVANQIGVTAVEVPGGSVKTPAGEILFRMDERKEWAKEFAELPIIATEEGSLLRLGDIATVTDSFEDTNRLQTFNGMPAAGIEVYRVGKETPIGVSDATRDALERIRQDLPPGTYAEIRSDMSDIYRQRLQLLLRNAFIGLCLVLLVLGIFLEFKLACWVVLGIPTSFLGAFLFLPAMDVSVNMISMFAFIVALGIVVDDAIVAGENIYEYRQQGMNFVQAAVKGAQDVAVPVTFSILTNIVAFLPLMFVPGIMGKIWRVIPLVVSTVFLISWIESLLILPSHLAHGHGESSRGLMGFVHRQQQRFSRVFIRGVNRIYGPFLDFTLRFRYITVAMSIALLTVVLGYAYSGRMGFVLMPRVESDRAVVTAVLPYGSAMWKAQEVADRLYGAAQKVVEKNGKESLSEGIRTQINENEVEVSVYLTDPDIRPISTRVFAEQWRKATGNIAGLESLRFESDRGGPGSGASLTVELSHRNIETLDRAGEALAALLAEFPNVKDIDDGYTPGKTQLTYTLTPEGHSLGLTVADVARQVRSSFYGAEALRQQRGRNEIKVMVRRPECERISEYDIEQLLIRTPAGTDVPLRQVAKVERGNAYSSINRREGRRTIEVTADVEPYEDTSIVQASLVDNELPQLTRDYPGLTWGFEGRQADMKESMQSLVSSFILAMMIIYVLLAIPFKSYVQPAIVMVAIPFGIVGAILGHLVMGYSLSVISMMGIVALSGVVVNDSLVMIDYANRRRREHKEDPFTAIHQAGVRRFRPIMLTTLTTFGGLAPMIFETSRQARFMIPMAISLGYGIIFATSITLVIVPSLYMMIEDFAHAGRSVKDTVSSEPIHKDMGLEGM